MRKEIYSEKHIGDLSDRLGRNSNKLARLKDETNTFWKKQLFKRKKKKKSIEKKKYLNFYLFYFILF
jgi:hypothetical protein